MGLDWVKAGWMRDSKVVCVQVLIFAGGLDADVVGGFIENHPNAVLIVIHPFRLGTRKTVRNQEPEKGSTLSFNMSIRQALGSRFNPPCGLSSSNYQQLVERASPVAPPHTLSSIFPSPAQWVAQALTEYLPT